MKSAKRLPCGHMFHRMCARQWLQRMNADGTCPICRRSVLAPTDAGGEQRPPGAVPEPVAATPRAGDAAAPGGAPAVPPAGGPPGPAVGTPQPLNFGAHRFASSDFAAERPLFRFSSSGIGSWVPLPDFTFELRTSVAFGGGRGGAVDAAAAVGAPTRSPHALDDMVRAVLAVLPQLLPAAVRADLLLTGSVEVTIERGLAGLLPYGDVPVAVPAPAAAVHSSAAPHPVEEDEDSDAIEAEVRAVDPKDRFALFQARKRAMLRRARRDYRRKMNA